MMRLAIIGPGLLGGSIALAARRFGGFHVALWARREEAVKEIETLNVADTASSDLREIVADADLIVLCVPIGAMPALARAIASLISPRTIVTDVGSVKGSVVAELSPIFHHRAQFVGSHPMAGSEQTGIRAARVDLFDGAVCIVTPDECSDAAAIEKIRVFWQSLGCKVTELPPEAHDEIVAQISHFPHLLAATLVQAVAAGNPLAFDFSGPGFRDVTRVASGPPAMWAEILHSNRRAVRKSAEAMIEKLREIVTLLDREEPMTEFLTQAQARRERLRIPKNTDV
jgi:prephenate dehydrogenase